MKLRDLGSGIERDAPAPPSSPAGVLAVRDTAGVVWVWRRGEVYRIAAAAGRPAAARDSDHGLVAPMPGKIASVLVEDGATVAKGATLLLLEAMKMEHPIRAPRDGVVRLLARAGEMVGLGDTLAEVK